MSLPRDLASLASEREQEVFITDTFRRRQVDQAEWKQRIETFDAFVAGNWVVQMPDGRRITDRPKIENRVISFAEDTAKLAASFMPTLRIEAPDEASVEWAAKRESVVDSWWAKTRLPIKMIPFYADLCTTGVGAFKIWPDFTQPHAVRYPKWTRIDPRGIYLPVTLAAGEPVDDVVIRKTVKLRTLARLYPEQAAALDSRTQGSRSKTLSSATDIEVIYYCDDVQAIEVALVPGAEDAGVVLYAGNHNLGTSPVVVGVRPTADAQLRGQFDTMIPIVSAENRIWTYVIDYADQMVYAPIKKSGNVGDITFGPNSVVDVGDGDVQRIAPAPGMDNVEAILGQLERQSRRAGVGPEARAGDVSQSIGSAAFVESLMGGLVTNVRTYQLVAEDVLVRCNRAAIAADQLFCNVPKTLSGFSRDGAFKFNYTPSKLFAGNGETTVSYGVGAGLDAFNREVRLVQRERSGYVSKRWVREQLEGMEQVLKVEKQILDERDLEVLYAGLAQQAQMGNLEPLARFHMAREEDINPLQVMHFIMASTIQSADEAAASAPSSPTSGAGVAAADENLALQKGGIPGNAPNLPPLNQVMV